MTKLRKSPAAGIEPAAKPPRRRARRPMAPQVAPNGAADVGADAGRSSALTPVMQQVVALVLLDVSELLYDSPEDQPDVMLVSEAELAEIVTRHLIDAADAANGAADVGADAHLSALLEALRIAEDALAEPSPTHAHRLSALASVRAAIAAAEGRR